MSPQEEEPAFQTQAEAIMHAILEVRLDGGGRVHLHREECQHQIANKDCPCDPISFWVEGVDG